MNEAMQYEREIALIGAAGLARLRRATVTVCGLGGVGSYVAEALARSGVGRLFLIDGDRFAPSNLNRQLGALTDTIGQAKTEVTAARIRQIDPEISVRTATLFLDESNAAVALAATDYLADAIDFLPAKVALAALARQKEVPLIAAMGAGKRLDPSCLQVVDISATHTCPLARRYRKALREQGIESGVTVVFSTENPKGQDTAAIGSMMFVPAAMGIMMASVIVRDLLRR